MTSEHRNLIKPIHSKVKSVNKSFKQCNDAIKISKLVPNFDQVSESLEKQLTHAHATTAITLGVCSVSFEQEGE